MVLILRVCSGCVTVDYVGLHLKFERNGIRSEVLYPASLYIPRSYRLCHSTPMAKGGRDSLWHQPEGVFLAGEFIESARYRCSEEESPLPIDRWEKRQWLSEAKARKP